MRQYFVDEAGDGVLFDRKGRLGLGREGCSRFFILGLVDAANPEALSRDLNDTRTRLLADPYFHNVPSMQLEAQKTAVAFHAKDDLPEVRREVFACLLRHPLRFFAVVRDKRAVADYVRQRNEREPAYHYHPNELYDALVRRLFKNLLHKDDEYKVYFSKRGQADRTAALRVALETARQRFAQQWGVVSTAPIHALPSEPRQQAGLQAADYCLWTLQRLYERREERYVEYLWPLFHMVHDVDDTRQSRYGVYYTQKKPLNKAALPELPGI